MWEETPQLLKNVDILVDGKFEQDNMKGALLYTGSANQRIHDLKNNKEIQF